VDVLSIIIISCWLIVYYIWSNMKTEWLSIKHLDKFEFCSYLISYKIIFKFKYHSTLMKFTFMFLFFPIALTLYSNSLHFYFSIFRNIKSSSLQHFIIEKFSFVVSKNMYDVQRIMLQNFRASKSKFTPVKLGESCNF
jgi:hypothetical protein